MTNPNTNIEELNDIDEFIFNGPRRIWFDIFMVIGQVDKDLWSDPDDRLIYYAMFDVCIEANDIDEVFEFRYKLQHFFHDILNTQRFISFDKHLLEGIKAIDNSVKVLGGRPYGGDYKPDIINTNEITWCTIEHTTDDERELI